MNPNDLRLLAALDALLQERNVTRAAARLHLSQPATSGVLARLRSVFGDPLLVRHGRELVPTARALELAPQVAAAMAQVGRLFGEAASPKPAELRREFHLAVSDAVGQVLIPPVVQRLAREAPGVSLRVSAAALEIPEAALANGAVDAVIAHHETVPPALRASTLYSQRLVVVVRRGHPTLSHRVTPARFVATPQVVLFPHAASLDDAMRRIYEQARQPFRRLALVQHLSTAAAIVRATDGLALMTEHVAAALAGPQGLKALPLPPSMPLPDVPVRVIWHERGQHDPAAAWLRGVLRECAAAIGGRRRGPGR